MIWLRSKEDVNWHHSKYPKPIKRQPHKMVKHTQTIRRLLQTNGLSVFDHLVGLVINGLNPFPINIPNLLISLLTLIV